MASCRHLVRLARALAAQNGETLTEAIRVAPAERLRLGETGRLAEQFIEIGRHCAALPDLDPRSPDERAGYDENGMW